MPDSPDITYIRRYLDDPSVINTIGPPITPIVDINHTADTIYIKRYLNDPDNSGNG